MSEYNCPRCNADPNGGFIWQHFYSEFTSGKGYWKNESGIYDGGNRLLSHGDAERVADEVASSYGATRTGGRWARAISPIAWGDDWPAYFHAESERDSVRDKVMIKATATLRELLQPTEGMVEAANKGPGKPTNAVASGIWVRMAQAALEGE